jgi:hypothetical protein
MNKDDRLYLQNFGNIPDNQLDRIAYILGKKADNSKYNDMIAKAGKQIKKIKYKKLNFTMWKLPYAAARPRIRRNAGYLHMYVPGAKKEGDWFEEFAQENQLPFIDTPCIINLNIYEKTPSSFSIKNKVLADLGLIRPWKRTGDIDNFCK